MTSSQVDGLEALAGDEKPINGSARVFELIISGVDMSATQLFVPC